MIVHAYLTNGFFPWAKLFLESFRYHNGIDTPIILTTRGLIDVQVDELNNIYTNIRVDNSDFDINVFCKKSGLDKKTLLRYKKEVETKHVTQLNKVWKLMIAGDDRIKSVYDVVKEHTDSSHKHLLHFDIDMYIRASLAKLFKFVRLHDISMRLRLNRNLNRKVMIGVQGYKTNEASLDFLNKWIKYIDNVKPVKRHLGYGQTSCYYAYRDVEGMYKWGDIPLKYIAARMDKSDIIWSANTSKGKTENLRLYRKDFKKIKGAKNE